MCHKPKNADNSNPVSSSQNSSKNNLYEPHPQTRGDNAKDTEPLPESSRERRDGPGGN